MGLGIQWDAFLGLRLRLYPRLYAATRLRGLKSCRRLGNDEVGILGGDLLDKNRITSLVRLAQTGDDLAFAELVRAYQDMAVAYAASILCDCHWAEEAAQEAFFALSNQASE